MNVCLFMGFDGSMWQKQGILLVILHKVFALLTGTVWNKRISWYDKSSMIV